MRVAIVGSRTITDYAVVESAASAAISQYLRKGDSLVILSGGAKGVDTLAKKFAQDNNLDFILFKPYHMIDTKVDYNPRFFFARNKQIADNSDVVVIVWDGKSNGSRHMIDYCKARKKPYELVTVEVV